ncbi:MAG: TIGR04283 family arsenosugar biosynthesis glycosyltransferase [Chloroflexota bacterium]|nr:TIGR04283 family arsenosugar biosynthesis glycosyltransferase [Chloroflexota bacterium]
MIGSTRISVIIPTLNEAATIGAVLRQFEILPGDWEVIVADSGSSDGTCQIAAQRPGVHVVTVARGRGSGMNDGAALATGEILLFLHADTFLPRDAHLLIARALADRRTSATAFRLRLDRDDWPYRLVPLASRVRVRLQRTFFGDQAIAVRRADFARIGGYREALLMEDVDLSRRLRRLGRLRLLPASVVTSARRFEEGGVVRTLVLMSGLQVLYACRVRGDRLARWYGVVKE